MGPLAQASGQDELLEGVHPSQRMDGMINMPTHW